MDTRKNFSEENFKEYELEDKIKLSGTEIYTDKADDSVVHVGVDGKSVLQTPVGEGRNLVRNSDFSNGVSRYSKYLESSHEIESVKDGLKVNLKGGGDYRQGLLTKVEPLQGTHDYMLSIILSISDIDFLVNGEKPYRVQWGSTSYDYDDYAELTDNTYQFTFKISKHNSESNGETLYMYRWNDKGADTYYIINSIKLEKGSAATPYSPAPEDVEDNIQSVNNFDIVSQKNTVDGESAGGEIGGRNLYLNSTDRYKNVSWSYWNAPLNYVDIEPNQKYTASVKYKDVVSTAGEVGIRIFWYDSAGKQLKESRNGTGIPDGGSGKVYVTDTAPSNATQVRVILRRYTNSGSQSAQYSQVKLEKGTVATDWTPAPEDNPYDALENNLYKTNILLSEPLRSVGNVKDRLFRDSDGIWKIERSVANKGIGDMGSVGTYSGSNEYHFNGGVAFLFYYPTSQISAHTGDIKSSHFKKTTSNNYNAGNSEVSTIHQLDPTRFSIRVPESTIGVTYANTTQEKQTAFRSWAKDNHVRVQYILDEPTVENLDQELQDKLNNLRSFKDSNYVYTVNNSNDLEPNLHGTFKSKAWHYKNEIEPKFNKFVGIDPNNRKKGYKINLAKPNQQTIASINEAYGANYSIKLGNINEVTFNVPYFIDKLDERVKNENIELIKEKMYTKISYNNDDEWMVIDTIEDVGSGDEKYMAVTAFTNVYETSNRKINELNLETVNPEEYYDAVLNDVSWSIGTIDPLFKDIYRSVELSNVTVLEAIITGAETFGAVLDFDTENKKINLIDMDSRAKYRGLNINYSNFLQSINRKRSVDEMTTRLYVYGSEDLSIENVNPTGMRYLEDFTYFLYPFERDENKNVIKSSHYMSDELAHAILDKNELSKEYQPQIKAMQEEIDEETVEYINETTLLNELRFDEMSVSGLLDIAKATGDNDLILQRQGELAEVKTKISIKELTVDHINATIEDLERQISQLQSQISVTSFSKELYDELSMYIIESEFRDDRYIDEEELYRDALKKFDESKSPSVVIEASIDNIIDSLEEDYYSDKVVLGDIARVTDKEMNVEMKSLIVELSFDLDNNTCDVTIANGDIEKDGYDRILSVLYDTQSTTTMLENNKYKWDTVTDVKTEVDLIRDGEIDATRNRIKAGFRESVTIEDRGIILSNPDFPNEIVIMQAGVIALSTDGGENWSTSITPRGVMADTIIGKLVASNNLIVTNDSGSFRIDGDGLTVDMDSIKIMSGEGDTPENIVDSWNKMLITMDEFADDGKLNEYEKNQIARQWNSIAMSHSSMVDAIQNAYGPETPENPYPTEYEIYMESYEELRGYLNDEIQSDGHTILDPLHRGETTDIDSDKYNRLVSDYEVNKDRFQTVIPLEFSQTFIEQTRQEISLNYVKNGEVATKLNLSEEGVRIDGRLLEVNSETHFNDDLVMNAGLIRSADGAINIDLNAGIINLSRPLTINAVPVATEEFVEENLADAIKDIDVEYGITSDKDTAPTDWSTTPPAWQDGKYIWSRTLTVYKNGNTEITDPVNITGATGSSGGIGQAGRSVKSIQEQYYLSTSPVDLENGSWVDSPPQWEEDKYIWTRSVITYENPSGVDRTDPVSISGQQGPKGEAGSDGKDAPLVKLSGQTQIIKVDNIGRLTPSTNFIVTASSVNTTISSWRYSIDGNSFITSPPMGVTRSGTTITVNPSLVEFTTLTIRVSDGKVSDDFTIAKAVDGATGKDGEDAYTVILTNESHTFAGNIISAVPSNTTTDIVAYKGNLRVPVTVDSVTGNPEGMGYQISSNGTINTRVTFSVDESLVEESGAIKLNLALGGQYITKEFSFAVAYKGERGEKGERGATGSRGPQGDEGVGVSSVTEHYLISNQSTGVTYSTSGWGTSIPTMTSELRFLWNYEEIHFTDGTSEPTLPVVVGVYGQQGPKGSEGEDGRSIENIEERYLATSSGSGVTRSTSGWTEEMQVTTPIEKFLWNYEIITWSKAPLKTYVEPIIIGIHGDKGETGEQGTGVKSAVVTYRNHTSGTATPPSTEWVETPPTPIKGQYMWTRTITTYTDNSDITTYSVAYNALDGQKGDTGGKGDEGTGISNTVIRYFQSTSGTTTPTGDGATTPPTPIQGQYNWTRTVITYTDGTSSTAWSTSYNAKDGQKGDTGATGSTGPKGDAGKGITDQTVTYQNHTNGTTAPTGSWVSSPSPVKGRYLWTRTVTTYTEGNPVTTYAVAYNATDGQNGSDGTGVSSTQVRYQQSTSGSATPTGTWQTSIPAPTKGRYLWTRTVITYTDGTNSTSYSTSYYATDGQKGDKGDTGARGPQGTQGPKGDNGQSQWTHIRYSANSNGSSMTTTPVSTTKYIGIAVTNSASAPVYTGFTWSKYVGDNGSQGPQGVQGPAGANGQPTYTWIKYADTPTSGMNDYPDGKKYIGMAFNKTTATESTSYGEYQWSLMPQNIEVGGRNLLLNTNQEHEASPREYMSLPYDLTPVFEEHGLDQEYTMSFDLKSKDISKNSSIQIYPNPGTINPNRHLFPTQSFRVTTEYQRFSMTFKPTDGNKDKTTTYISVYGQYDTGNFPMLRNIKLEKGNIATDWTEAPEDAQARLDDKVDRENLENYVPVEGYQEEIGEINTSLHSYMSMLEQSRDDIYGLYELDEDGNPTDVLVTDEDGEIVNPGVIAEINDLLNRSTVIENNLGEFTSTWNFLETKIIMGNEGMLVGEYEFQYNSVTGQEEPVLISGIMIGSDRIDFVNGDHKAPVAFITGNVLQINHGIFVKTLQVGGHKIETILGGHTIWQWIDPQN